MIGTGDEKAGTRDVGRGTRITLSASERLLQILSHVVGFAYALSRFLTFANHVPRTAFRDF